MTLDLQTGAPDLDGVFGPKGIPSVLLKWQLHNDHRENHVFACGQAPLDLLNDL